MRHNLRRTGTYDLEAGRDIGERQPTGDHGVLTARVRRHQGTRHHPRTVHGRAVPQDFFLRTTINQRFTNQKVIYALPLKQ